MIKKNAKVWRWKHVGTMMKARWHDGENAMVRWWKRDGTMLKTR
jgi:hypothetical protein